MRKYKLKSYIYKYAIPFVQKAGARRFNTLITCDFVPNSEQTGSLGASHLVEKQLYWEGNHKRASVSCRYGKCRMLAALDPTKFAAIQCHLRTKYVDDVATCLDKLDPRARWSEEKGTMILDHSAPKTSPTLR